MDTNPLSDLVEGYLTHCHARGLALKTVDAAYAWPLKNVLLPWAAKQGLTDPAQITPKVLDQLSTQLLTKGWTRGTLTKATVHGYLRPVNQMLAWARGNGEEAGNGHAQLPKLPRRDIDVLSREEIDRLEDAARTERDKLMVRVLADTGVRVGELVKLTTSDLIERDRKYYLLVHGKGSKDRLVPVPHLRNRLERFIKARPKGTACDRIFLSWKHDPKTGDYAGVTESGVQQCIRYTAQAAGLKKRVHPHLFRHSFATWQINQGTHAIALANMLGHESLRMITNVYSHLSPADAYDAFLKSLK
jgi:integrase/recombinase XerD